MSVRDVISMAKVSANFYDQLTRVFRMMTWRVFCVSLSLSLSVTNYLYSKIRRFAAFLGFCLSVHGPMVFLAPKYAWPMILAQSLPLTICASLIHRETVD